MADKKETKTDDTPDLEKVVVENKKKQVARVRDAAASQKPKEVQEAGEVKNGRRTDKAALKTMSPQSFNAQKVVPDAGVNENSSYNERPKGPVNISGHK